MDFVTFAPQAIQLDKFTRLFRYTAGLIVDFIQISTFYFRSTFLFIYLSCYINPQHIHTRTYLPMYNLHTGIMASILYLLVAADCCMYRVIINSEAHWFRSFVRDGESLKKWHYYNSIHTHTLVPHYIYIYLEYNTSLPTAPLNIII